ncbi:MAG: 2-amino-4-hydroxy-6-hydroxymethyldihydropteridine diphosphokinase [Thermodesulfobacteriota bacterium]|nr:2-amino-4-hydroxy-6-hydroxymethyldihydropteridine diphosphokinase [Thermodesulfobacteriota bacterium]
MEDVLAYIGIGSNLGDAKANCLQAAARLAKADNRLKIRLSSLYLTEPQELKAQEWYVNAAAEVKGPLYAQDLFCLLHRIEDEMGRERAARYGPRIIDLDLLFYDDMVLDTGELIIPHPRLHKRRFVLVPLCELSPDFEHPVLKKRVCDLLKEVPENGQRVRRIEVEN